MAELPISAERLKKCRKDHHWVRQEVSDRAQDIQGDKVNALGCAPEYITKLENGLKLSPGYASLLGKVYGVKPEYLLGETDFPTDNDKRVAWFNEGIDLSLKLHQACNLFLEMFGFKVQSKSCVENGNVKSVYILSDREGNTIKTLSKKEYDDFELSILKYAKFSINELIGGM